MERIKRNLEYLYPVIGVVLFLVVWQVAVMFFIREEWLLPSPLTVIQAFVDEWRLLWQHSLYTLTEALVGMAISVPVSVGISWVMAIAVPVRKALYPLILVSQMVPIIVLAPLFLIWFGYGILPKILVVILICFFPMVINMMAGFSAADAETLAFYRSMGASRAQVFRLVRLPYALPYFFGGLRVAASYSIMGAVVGEWLGAQSGLGLLLIRAQRSFDLPLVFADILAIIIWSSLIFILVAVAEHWLLGWRRATGEHWGH